LERNINRFIEREFGHSPSTYRELTHIPFQLGTTKNDEPFLLVFQKYFKPDSTECGIILAFATTSDLRKLFQATHGVIMADGTFKIKPHPYAKTRGSQVFTLNTLEGTFPSRRMFRRLLALLPCKSEHCYYTFLRMMIQAAVERGIDLSAPGAINWRRLMCDFELGIHNAFCDLVFNVLLIVDFALEYCHMHFCSSLIKNIKTIGLSVAYSIESSGLRHVVAKLFALPFLPFELMRPVYDYIVANKMNRFMLVDGRIQSFLTYFEKTYLENDNYTLEALSVFNRDDLTKRTTNDLEARKTSVRKLMLTCNLCFDLCTKRITFAYT